MSSTAVVFDLIAHDRASSTFDRFGNSVDGSSSKMSKFTNVAKVAGKAAAYGLGAGLVIAVGAGVKFAQAAAEDAQAADLLKGALERNAGATKKQVADVEDWITAIGRAKGVADDDLRPALARLVTATHDVGRAQLLAQVAMDVSAGTGKSLESVSTALMKAQNGQVSALSRLGINTKLTAGEQQAYARAAVEASKGTITMEQALKTASSQTITMDQAVSRMSDTFGGAASAKAETFQGKMDRLKLMLSETGEAIGYKLIPIGMKLMDWITGSAIPAVEQFTAEWQKGVGVGGEVRGVLERVGTIVKDVATFLWDHKAAVVALVAGYVAYKATMVAVSVVQAVQLAILKAHTVGTIENTVVSKIAAVAAKSWAAAQWILNAALTANPIGLVVIGVAALAAGLVIAYKKSETFRDVVKTGMEVISKAATFMWNNVYQPVLTFLIGAIGKVIEVFADMVEGMSHVPGFGWLGGVADKMHAAAAATDGLSNSIKKIPEHKTVTIDVQVNQAAINKVKEQLGEVLPRGAAGGRGATDHFGLGKNSVGGPGAALIESIVSGIDKGKVKLQTALDKVKGYIQKHQESLTALLEKRAAIVDSFKGFASSIFGADTGAGNPGGPQGLDALLAFQANQKAKAQQLQADVGSLIGKGISKDLLTQLQGSGEAGEEQIHLLAGATAEQLKQANDDNAATQAALQAAGLAASEAQGIEAGIRQEEANIKLADTIKAGLAELLALENKNTYVVLRLDGKDIVASIEHYKRKGGKP